MAAIIAQLTRAKRERAQKVTYNTNKCLYQLPPFDAHFDPLIHNRYLARWRKIIVKKYFWIASILYFRREKVRQEQQRLQLLCEHQKKLRQGTGKYFNPTNLSGGGENCGIRCLEVCAVGRFDALLHLLHWFYLCPVMMVSLVPILLLLLHLVWEEEETGHEENTTTGYLRWKFFLQLLLSSLKKDFVACF